MHGNRPPPQSRIFFDITDIVEYSRHSRFVSGIQRVGLQVMANCISRNPAQRFSQVVFDHQQEVFLEVDPSWCSPDYEFECEDFRRRLKIRSSLSAARILAYYRGRPLKKVYHLFRHGLRKLCTPVCKPWYEVGVGKPVTLGPNDTYVLLGGTWGMEAHAAALRELASKGVRIVPLIYDIIPVKMPEHVVPGLTQQFRPWLDNLYAVASRIMTISEWTARDVREDMKRRSDRSIDVVATPLAHEFLGRNAGGTVRNDLANLAHRPFVLCVGTIESRKNGWGLVRAWQRLVAEQGLNAPRLIFAGKHGWLKYDFDQVMAATGHVYGHVQIVDSATDEELAWLYEHCLFTVFPSFYEGWGLPIGESLWFGKTCVASKTSSMPEVGGNMCLYVDPYDVEQLYKAVRKLIVDVPARRALEKKINRKKLRVWSDVADDVFAAIVSAEVQSTKRPPKVRSVL